MPRKLNPDYLRRVMAQEELHGLEAVYLTGNAFNVADRDERQPPESKCIAKTRNGGIYQIQTDYFGWTKEGKLYCRSCWGCQTGIPREIMQRNWCEICKTPLYPEEDAWLDMRGFDLYRELIKLYMSLAVRKYLQFIEGCEHWLLNGRMREGYHKDHIYSVRDGFENDIPAATISAPPNLRVIEGKPNLSKGRKSACTLEEMLAKYATFLLGNPEWPDAAQQSYLRQETFICRL